MNSVYPLQLSTLGHWTTWPIVFLTFFIGFVKARSDRVDMFAKKDGQELLEIILEVTNAAKEEKLSRFLKYIRDNKGIDGLLAFRDITQPRDQIERILDNMQIAFSKIFIISRDKIGISIIYRTYDDEEWDWLYRLNVTHGMTLRNIMNNPNTSARQIADRREQFIFYPNKNDAINEKKYVSGSKDKQYGNVGSIYCQDISLGDDDKYLTAILSVTTYGIQLCETDHENAKEKIQTLIMPTFEKRIRLEFALMYIKEVMTPKCLECL